MDRALELDSKKIFPLIQEFLESQKAVQLTITGNSMFPLLRHGIDSVQIGSPEVSRFQRGDIILYKRHKGQYILHRLIEKTDQGYFMAGDMETGLEGPIALEQIIGVVSCVYRGQISVKPDSFKWKCYTYLFKNRSFSRKVLVKLLSVFRPREL